jgi:hypothetical protein
LSPEFLFSTCSTPLEWLSTILFIWFKELFISQDFCVVLFFWGFSHLC